MKQFLSLAAFVALIGIPAANAQQSGSWKNYKSLEKIDIDYSRQQCTFKGNESIADYYFLKLTNKTAQDLKVTMRIEYYFDGTCNTCANDEYLFTFSVPANGSIQPGANCMLNTLNDRLAVYIGSANKPNKQVLEKFEVTNIVIQ